MATIQEHGFIATISTNGSHPKEAVEIATNFDIPLFVSLDHHNEARMDHWRGSIGAFKNATDTIQQSLNRGVNVSTSILLSRWNISEIGETVRYSNEVLGCPAGICYPSTGKEQYPLTEVGLTEKELLRVYLELRGMMNDHPSWFMDFPQYYDEIIRRLRGNQPRYGCLAGSEVFYVDWFGQLHACFRKDWNSGICFECLQDCFILPSMVHQALHAHPIDLIHMCIYAVKRYGLAI